MKASCDFEEDLCNFYQDKEGPGWTRVKVKPNMYRTGDHTTGLGRLKVCPCGIFRGGIHASVARWPFYSDFKKLNKAATKKQR